MPKHWNRTKSGDTSQASQCVIISINNTSVTRFTCLKKSCRRTWSMALQRGVSFLFSGNRVIPWDVPFWGKVHVVESYTSTVVHEGLPERSWVHIHTIEDQLAAAQTSLKRWPLASTLEAATLRVEWATAPRCEARLARLTTFETQWDCLFGGSGTLVAPSKADKKLIRITPLAWVVDANIKSPNWA